MNVRCVSPRAAALAVLRARFGSAGCPADSGGAAVTGVDRAASDHAATDLAAFQADAARRLQAIIDRWNGAILADSVGLGKTHVARALIRAELALARGAGATAAPQVLVTAPAALRSHWARQLRHLDGWEWLSHTALSRGRAPRRAPTLVVIDEAHAFRNPAARRYDALLRAAGSARLLLLTATPVNNSILDFYHIVRLFAARGAFADIGVSDLLTAAELAAAGSDTGPIRRVAEQVMVRRTRAVVEQWPRETEYAARRAKWPAPAAAASPGSAPVLTFPRRAPVELVGYDLERAFPGLAGALGATLRALSFPAHALSARAASWRQTAAGGTVAAIAAGAGNATSAGSATGAAELMRLALLKRLESGPAAFDASLRRLQRTLEYAARAAGEGLLFDVRRDRGLLQEVDGATQLVLSRLALPPWPRHLDRRAFLADAAHELDRLHALRAHVQDVTDDPKLDALRRILDRRQPGDAVLLFTEYRETAVQLWRALVDRGGVALIHGADTRLGRARASRRAVISRFAPFANGCRAPPAHQRVTLLIATDVLAEGLNLQDAGTVISYDMPWNPVRLAQRIGRIDRLGSPHDVIRTIVFRPDRGVDALLGLLRRVRRKLRAIRIVGGDAPSLTPRGARDALSELELTERLRLELARADDARAGAVGASVFAACLDLPIEDGALVLWAATPVGVRAVLVRVDGTVQLDPAAADGWLAAALGRAHPLPCDADACPVDAWADAAWRTARRALTEATATTAGSDRAVIAAARVVRRWLGGRPGGAAPHDAARADRLLARLRSCSTAQAARLRHAGGDRAQADDATIEAIEHALADAASSPNRPAAEGVPPGLCAIAMLSRPSTAAAPEGSRSGALPLPVAATVSTAAAG